MSTEIFHLAKATQDVYMTAFEQGQLAGARELRQITIERDQLKIVLKSILESKTRLFDFFAALDAAETLLGGLK